MKLKKLKGILLGFILGGIFFGGIGVAAITLTAKEIKYTPSNENFTVTNASDAIDELYKIAGTVSKSRVVSKAFSLSVSGTSNNTTTYFSETYSISITDICPNYEKLTKENIYFALNEGTTVLTGPAYSAMYISNYSYEPSTGIVTVTVYANNFWTSARTYTLYGNLLVVC